MAVSSSGSGRSNDLATHGPKIELVQNMAGRGLAYCVLARILGLKVADAALGATS